MVTPSKAKAATAAARKTPVRRAASTARTSPVAVKSVVRPVGRKSPVQTVAKKVVTSKAAAVVMKPVVADATPSKKVKLVRDSFSFPKHEHALLGDIKKRALKLGKEFKKSEVLRAGLVHMASLTDSALVALLSKVERVKTGRPPKKSKKK